MLESKWRKKGRERGGEEERGAEGRRKEEGRKEMRRQMGVRIL